MTFTSNKNLLAIPFFTAVKQYAISRGLPFWTWAQLCIAIRLYKAHAQINN